MDNIISNCPLCEQHSLHLIGDDDMKLMQCINCGYTSTDKYLGNKNTNEEYRKLTDEMKDWAIENDGRIWIPTMMTLPTGMLYPVNDKDKVMKWGYAEMVDIPKEEQNHYPVPNQENKFYERRYDVENSKIYDEFFQAMFDINEGIKKDLDENKPKEIKLPKLKKIDG